MKPDLWRRDLGAYPWQHPLQVRSSDVDTARHINNVAVMALHAEACQRFGMTRLPQHPPWRHATRPLQARRLVASFVAETHYPADVQAGLRLLHTQAEGAVLATALFQHGQCVSTQETTWSAWDNGLPVPLNADEQAQLAPHTEPLPAPAMPLPAHDIGLPLQRAQYPLGESITTRFGDHDGHWLLHERTQLRCVEQVRSATLFKQMQQAGVAYGQPGGGVLLMASKRVEFLCLRRVPPQIDACVVLKHLGTTSINMAVGLFDGDVCIARADGAAVLADPQTLRPQAVPPRLREVLEALRPVAG